MKLLSGPSLATWRIIIWAKWGSLSGPRLFFAFFVVSGDFLQTKLSFCVVFGAQLSANFLKITFFFFQKKGAIVYLNFCVVSYFVFCLLKHYKNWCFNKFWVFCCCKRRNKQKMITGISEFEFFFAVSWRTSETPILVVFFGCALLGPSWQKREILDTHKKLTDNSKAHFLVFCVFFLGGGGCLFVFFCFFLVFLGSGEEARTATSLGPKPSLFVFFVCLFCFFVFFFSVFCFWVIKTCFPLKTFFVYFWVSPFVFSWAFFGLPIVQFIFLCLSLVLFFFLFCHLFLFSFGSFFIIGSDFLFLFHEK